MVFTAIVIDLHFKYMAEFSRYQKPPHCDISVCEWKYKPTGNTGTFSGTGTDVDAGTATGTAVITHNVLLLALLPKLLLTLRY